MMGGNHRAPPPTATQNQRIKNQRPQAGKILPAKKEGAKVHCQPSAMMMGLLPSWTPSRIPFRMPHVGPQMVGAEGFEPPTYSV